MKSVKIKLLASFMCLILILAITPFMGLTTAAQDTRQGVMIDFGYWDVNWTEMSFTEEINGIEALEAACHINDYEFVYLDKDAGTIYSINGQINLDGKEWAMYLQTADGWELALDPYAVNAADYDLICWARAGGVDDLIPGTDYTGFNYYSYASDGKTLTTGEDLKIISLAPSITEMVAAVGGTQYLIGTDLYSNYPQEIIDKKDNDEISVVGGYTDPSYEWIIKLNPDLVLCDGGVGEHLNMANKLRKSGIDCVVLYNGTDIGTLYDNLWIVAAALGIEENANSVINSLRGTINDIKGIIGVQANKRVFVALSADPSPWTAGSETYMNDLIVTVSGKNIFQNQASSWFMVSKEQISLKQPEVMIIIVDSREISTDEEYQKILDSIDRMWRETPAYRNGEVYVFSGSSADLLSRPGPRLAEAAELIGKILHPDPFLKRDPLDLMPKYFDSDYQQYLKHQRGI